VIKYWTSKKMFFSIIDFFYWNSREFFTALVRKMADSGKGVYVNILGV